MNMVHRMGRVKGRDGDGRIRSRLLLNGVLGVCFLLLAAVAPASSATPVHLVFAGSGTNLPLIRLLAAEFMERYPEVEIEVPASIGSTGGIRAAADGAIALGLISRPLREKEQGLGLRVSAYARTPVLIAVHPSVAEDQITHAELLDIYRGTRTRWQDGGEIIVLTREPGDSSIEVLVEGVPGFRAVYDESQEAGRWTTLLRDLVMNQTLARTPQAIGLSDLGAVTIEKHAIKPLRVNGVTPTPDNVENGSYPLFKTLAFIYREEALPAAARHFIDFVRSEQGGEIMRANGYVSGQ
jgi:phosphate transport system substrate-binding protein